MRLGGRWDDKGVFLFYLDLMTDLFQMVVYLCFFVLICTYYGLPLHIMRDLYLTIRSFRTRVADFIRYRRITHNMQERFPDATEEELERSDRVCIICRENMTSAKKLACGHMFHFHCLRSWLERQQTCPTCRAPIEAPDAPTAANAANLAANLANLANLNLDYTSLSGTLSSQLANLGNLASLDLGDTSLSGTLSSELGKLGNLAYLGLGLPALSGTLSSQLANLVNVA